MSLIELSAAEAARRIRDGEMSSEELVRAHLDRIEQVDPDIEAWTHLQPEFALEQARALDQVRASGENIGPLHGVPVAVKDIFDTADFPTENGSVLDAGRQPDEDCHAVSRLKQAGAVIMGKTVTTEFAVFSPGKTKNPHNTAHTPGGSSSGSAAAVASYMVPLAIGTQTNGSVIRPASYCGVVGFKPTHGLISRTGALKLSQVLDHVGVFARDIGDAALIADALAGFDAADPDTRLRAAPAIHATAENEPPVPPNLAFIETSAWARADDDIKEGFAELTEALGGNCVKVELGAGFDDVLDRHSKIMNTDLAVNLARYHEKDPAQISEQLRAMIADGEQVLATDYNRSIQLIAALNAALDEVFENFDAIVTPAATGEAPAGLDATGDPAFATLWTLLGTPAVTLPLLEGSNGLPIGVQLVSARGDDARLMRTARWLTQTLG